MVSKGNIEVLSKIPIMMSYKKWRDALRKLVLDFITEETLHGKK